MNNGIMVMPPARMNFGESPWWETNTQQIVAQGRWSVPLHPWEGCVQEGYIYCTELEFRALVSFTCTYIGHTFWSPVKVYTSYESGWKFVGGGEDGGGGILWDYIANDKIMHSCVRKYGSDSSSVNLQWGGQFHFFVHVIYILLSQRIDK